MTWPTGCMRNGTTTRVVNDTLFDTFEGQGMEVLATVPRRAGRVARVGLHRFIGLLSGGFGAGWFDFGGTGYSCQNPNLIDD